MAFATNPVCDSCSMGSTLMPTRSAAIARRAVRSTYLSALDKFKLDGFVCPAIQMPPPDESMPQDGRVSEGPHSATSWVNMIGVPAIVVPAGFYESEGCPLA